MKICLNVGIGCGKTECEDTAVYNDTLVNDKTVLLESDMLQCIGVADGVGGNAGGRIASRYIAHQVSQADFLSMTQRDIHAFVTDINVNLISHAASIPDKSEMATTLTCVVAAKDGYYLIHAGNTRLYVMQGSYLKQLTTDHTTYNWLMECGQYEAAETCRKSEINCCFGGGTQRYANRLIVEKVFGKYFPDTFLLTSDGIHDFVSLDCMEDALSSSDSDSEAAQIITDTARKNGSTDDTTIIILRR
mgnify:CR=1 FL=1